jgi:hypothetical protein
MNKIISCITLQMVMFTMDHVQINTDNNNTLSYIVFL